MVFGFFETVTQSCSHGKISWISYAHLNYREVFEIYALNQRNERMPKLKRRRPSTLNLIGLFRRVSSLCFETVVITLNTNINFWLLKTKLIIKKNDLHCLLLTRTVFVIRKCSIMLLSWSPISTWRTSEKSLINSARLPAQKVTFWCEAGELVM